MLLHENRLHRLTALYLFYLNLFQPASSSFNVTVDSSSTSISYSPAYAWCSGATTIVSQTSHLPCIPCPHQSYSQSQSHRSRKTCPSKSVPKDATDWRVWRRIRRLNPFNPNPSDESIILQANFFGSAVYVFGYTCSVDLPKKWIEIKIDNVIYVHSSTFSKERNPCSTSTSIPIFAETGLSDHNHKLVITIPNTTLFQFHHIIFTREVRSPNKHMVSEDASQVNLLKERGDNVVTKGKAATFAAVIASIVGVLALLSAGLAFNIIRRRRRAAKRDQEENPQTTTTQQPHAIQERHRRGRGGPAASLESIISENSSRMQGPEPFLPRFFPDTIIPNRPQSYSSPHSPPQPISSQPPILDDVDGDVDDRQAEGDPPPYVALDTAPVQIPFELLRNENGEFSMPRTPPGLPPPFSDDISPTPHDT